MKKIYFVLSLALVAFLSFSLSFVATAAAGGAVAPADGSWVDLAKPVYDAVMHGQWWLAASFGIVLAVTLFKKYAPGKAGEWAKTDVGGAVLVLLGSFGLGLVNGILAVGPTAAVSLAMAWTALKVAFTAAGGYALLKKLAVPYIQKLANIAPAWLKVPLNLVLWVFDKGSSTIAEAEAAGAAAVQANPGKGTASVTTPTDI